MERLGAPFPFSVSVLAVNGTEDARITAVFLNFFLLQYFKHVTETDHMGN